MDFNRVMGSFRYTAIYALFFIACIFHSGGANAQINQQKIPEKTRILFLLDASGSMLAKWENTYRIVVAKQLLANLVDSLSANQNLELALRVYGHQYHRKFQNCQDSRLEVPFHPDNHETIKSRLKSLTPQGNTPIAYSLEQAANDFPADGEARNVIIIITDGIESCDGDPCAVSLALQRKGIFLKPFIIGIGMDKKFEDQFKCVGDFFDASDISSFKNALNEVVRRSLERATVSVELLDINDRPVETDVNVTFINNFTREAAYEFVHYLDRNGRPDTVEVDPVLTYDLVVNTIPPVVKRNVGILGGKHNVLRVKSPQGFLRIDQKGHTEYEKGVKVLLRRAGDQEIIHIMDLPATEKTLVGTYDIEALTLPRSHFRHVAIGQNKTTAIVIPSPGVVNISSNFPGFGSLYLMKEAGGQEWVCNLDPNSTRTTLALQPGVYKAVFRSRNSNGSKYTQFQKFTIKPGSSLNIRFSY